MMKKTIKPLFFAVVAGIAALTLAHGGGHPTRYVAPDGADSGECGSPTTACATINFAVQQSNKGDKIRVAQGRYVLDELEVFYLLSAMIEIKGGYSVADGFKEQKSAEYLTTIEGIPFSYRKALADRGFRLLQDAKGQEKGLSANEKTWLQTYSKLTSARQSEAECVAGMAGENPCHNIDRVAHMPLSQFSSRPTSASDIWGFVDLNNQREYALIGFVTGTSIVDVTDASKPVEVGHIAGSASTWRDVKVYQYYDDSEKRYQAYAYITTESDQGLQVVDLSDLPNSVSLSATRRSDFVTAHNVYLANVDYATGLALEGMTPYLYIAGSNRSEGVFLTYGLDDPERPNLLTEGSSDYVHDATSLVIDDSRTTDCKNGHNPCEILVDFNEDTVDIWDVTDKTGPLLISETSYPNVGYVHSGWWSQDKQTIFVQDETDERDNELNTTLRALDISDLKNPSIAGIYTGPTRAIDHNGFTKGDYYYMSNYRRGLTVLDVSDPTNMTEVGFFDTFAVPEENSASFNGAWGTYPYLPSGNILVSDIEYGLWILTLNENDGESPSPVATPNPTTDNSAGSGGGGSVPPATLLFMLMVAFIGRVLRPYS